MLYSATAPERSVPASLRGRPRLFRPQCAAGKGFGSNSNTKKFQEDDVEAPSNMKRVKSKGKIGRRLGVAPTQPPKPPVQQGTPEFSQFTESSGANLMDELEFEQRLRSLKQEAELRRQEVKATEQSAGGILDARRKEDIYANPPPLAQTLFGGKKEGGDEYEGASFGPGQVGLAAASLALVGVFIIANGNSDLVYMMGSSSGSKAVQQAEPRKVELRDEQRDELERQLVDITTQLAESPDSTEALEGAAVINARLGNFKEAVEQLKQLAAARANDPDVWRVLAESQMGLGDRAGAIESYRRAWQEVLAAGPGAGGALDVLQGLAGELVAAGQEQQAESLVKEARALVAAQQATPDATAAVGSSRLGPVEVELLLGKVYSQWKGHTPDALRVYDSLSQSYPEDFRVFLAKGLVLRDQGRAADAQRAFIQARFLAPPSSRPVVDSIINQPR